MKKIDNTHVLGYGYPETTQMLIALNNIAHILSLPFFCVLLRWYRQSSGYLNKTFEYAFGSYWRIYGLYIVHKFLLWCIAPRAVCLANDHSANYRSLLLAANERGIPTFYIQHSSVTENFPPLMFTYALLDGYNALNKYIAAGTDQNSNVKVFLIGMTKIDNYMSLINKNDTVSCVAICTNPLDPLPRVEELCQNIRLSFPNVMLLLRPHPLDKHRRSLWNDIATQYTMQFSDAEIEHPFSFLSRTDMVIAGDSGILLEAALLNVYPLYYDFAQKRRDHYGFVQTGLVQHIESCEEAGVVIRSHMQHKPYIRDRAKGFCATIDTPYDGQSAILASEIIVNVTQGNMGFLSKWKRISGLPIEAYELA
jgi:hypothetical protein